jgi:hypothetical protein
MSAKLRQALRLLAASRRPNDDKVFTELTELATGAAEGAQHRATVIVGASLLEEALREVISTHLLPTRSPDCDALLFEDEHGPLVGLAAHGWLMPWVLSMSERSPISLLFGASALMGLGVLAYLGGMLLGVYEIVYWLTKGTWAHLTLASPFGPFIPTDHSGFTQILTWLWEQQLWGVVAAGGLAVFLFGGALEKSD